VAKYSIGAVAALDGGAFIADKMGNKIARQFNFMHNARLLRQAGRDNDEFCALVLLLIQQYKNS